MNPDNNTPVRPGGLLFATLFVIVAVLLVTQLETETQFSGKGKLFAQPRFWPAVGVIGMVIFGIGHLCAIWWTTRKISIANNPFPDSPTIHGWGAEVFLCLRAFEYLVWFMVYVNVVPQVGYLPATIAFTVLLALRQGYRGRVALGCAAGLGFSVVVIFKSFLAVKIPGGAIYEYLPGTLRTFMLVNF